MYTIEDQINDHYLLTYNAQAHPQFLSNDELLISYNVNDTYDTIPPDICPSQCKNAFLDRMDADSYRPKFVRVPLGLMGLKEVTSFKLQQVGIFPNPAATTLQVTIPSNNEGACTISVFNKMGVVVLTKETQLTPGQNEFSLDIVTLPADVYLLKVQTGDGNQSWEIKKFIHQY